MESLKFKILSNLKSQNYLLCSSDWVWANDNFSKQDIKDTIASIIIEKKIPLPYREITQEDCLVDFENLKNHNLKWIDSKWFSRYEYRYDFLDRVIPCENTGNRSSDYFHQAARWKCDSINSPSPYRVWQNKKFLNSMLGCLWTLGYSSVDQSTLRNCIALRKYIASQFRPSAAKSIYDEFQAKNVLDFCSGWGDRLSGFMASGSTQSYTGIDPNSLLHPQYEKQIKIFGRNKSIKMIKGCAEDDLSLPREHFDLIMTSPPYFNVERYTQENTQSFKRHNKRCSGQEKLDYWLEGFLFPSISNAWESLKPNGTMLINISDVYSGHRVNKICDPMNDYISQLQSSKYMGAVGYQMRKRPNSGALKNKEGIFCEPIWIWKKLDS